MTNEFRGFQANTACPWMIVYPAGNRSWLAIAQVRDYQKSEWDLASPREFEFEYDARDYMIELADRLELRYEGQRAYLY